MTDRRRYKKCLKRIQAGYRKLERRWLDSHLRLGRRVSVAGYSLEHVGFGRYTVTLTNWAALFR